MDIVHRIRSFNAGRDPERLQLKYRAMRAGPFAFLRGTCHLFYERLPRGGVFRSAPAVWSCGDLHLENFGSYKGDNRLVYFDMNDFDEAALAPASWDLARFLTSLRLAAGGLEATEKQVQALCEAFVDAYAAALVAGKALWVERDTAQGMVRSLLDGLRDRTRADFLDTRTLLRGGRRRLRLDGKRALPASQAQQAEVRAFMRGFAQAQPDPRFYKLLDVARRIAGTGSLGIERYVLLVRGKGAPGGHYLLDLKQALPSSLLPHLRIAQPRWPSEAHRVVTLQRRLQAVPMAFAQPVQVGGRACVLRGLQPAEDRIAWAGQAYSAAELAQLVGVLGRLVAWAQLRSSGRQGSAIADELVAFGARRKWKVRLLDASHALAVQVRRDAAIYDSAFDDGAFAR